MDNHFNQIMSTSDLENVLARSNDAPIVLFKHSSTCSISSSVYRRMSEVEADVSLVIVQRAREVSNEIASRFGVKHESPQVVVVRNGKPVWTASHFNITTDAVDDAVRANA